MVMKFSSKRNEYHALFWHGYVEKEHEVESSIEVVKRGGYEPIVRKKKCYAHDDMSVQMLVLSDILEFYNYLMDDVYLSQANGREKLDEFTSKFIQNNDITFAYVNWFEKTVNKLNKRLEIRALSNNEEFVEEVMDKLTEGEEFKSSSTLTEELKTRAYRGMTQMLDAFGKKFTDANSLLKAFLCNQYIHQFGSVLNYEEDLFDKNGQGQLRLRPRDK